ncbi:MAG: ABC transporter permease [Chloroflexi bacterium]|nr:ABC transporter permease [Chloroflexota bacterium]
MTVSAGKLRSPLASIIAAASGFGELYRYRELVANLVVRDLKLRYRNSVLGFLWCLVNPLLMMGVFTLVFTVMMPNNQIQRFPTFILVGILAWNLHSTALGAAMNSVVGNAHLVQKVYFPREVLPIAVVLANAVNFLLALLVVFPIALLEGGHLSYTLLLLPLVVINQVLFTMGVGLFLAAINVYFRDTSIIMDTIMTAWFFLTPVFYRIEDLFPAYSRLMYILNPPASFIASYRDILYHGSATNPDFFVRTFLSSLTVFAIGYLFFRHRAQHFNEAL